MQDSFGNDNQPTDGSGIGPCVPYRGSASISDQDLDSAFPRTPDGTLDASRVSGDFAKTLPNNPRELVHVIKGLLQEHPPMSPHTWQTSYGRGRCFASLNKLSFLAFPCYLAWYHATVAYEKYLASGSSADNNQFQKMWLMAQRVCNDESGNNSPPIKRSPMQVPSTNNKTPSISPLPADDYKSNSPLGASPETFSVDGKGTSATPPSIVPPKTAPREVSSSDGKRPPLAQQRPAYAPVNNVRSASPNRLHVEKYGPISDTFLRKLDAAEDTIPAPLRALVQRKGFKLRLIYSISDYNPRIAKQRPRGYLEGWTYAQLPAYTDLNSGNPAIVIAEKYKLPPRQAPQTAREQTLVEHTNPEETFRHEFGHALDNALDNFSSNPALQKAYKDDLAKIKITLPGSLRSLLDYYLPNRPDENGPSEVFAEIFASKFGGGPNSGQIDKLLNENFSNVSKLMDQKIKQLTEE